jgi:hypothetical protein
LKTPFRIVCGILMSIAALCVCADADADNLGNCEQWLRAFLPERVVTSSYAMRATVDLTSQEYVPTREMKIQQLTEEYWDTLDHQEQFPTVEAFVATLLDLIDEEEANRQAHVLRRSRMQMLLSSSNAYARYYGEYDIHNPTQEVVQVKIGRHEWKTTYVDHSNKKIYEHIVKNRNEFSQFFSALSPQNAHRDTWEILPMLLKAENKNTNVATELCSNGIISMSNMLFGVKKIDESNCLFFNHTKVPNGMLEVEYRLQKGKHIRLIHYAMNGPELSTKVSYEYADPDKQWPTRQHLVDRNTLSQQTRLDRSMAILEVVPEDRWDFKKILDALILKHIDYDYVQIESHTKASMPAAMPQGSAKVRNIDPNPSGNQAGESRKYEVMDCPRCMNQHDRKKNCTLCAGDGRLWVEKGLAN